MVDIGCCDSNGGTTPYALDEYDSSMVNYSENIAIARSSYAYDFLVLGRMLHDLNISSPSTVIPATTQRIPYEGGTVPSFTSPSVFGSAWRAPDGSIAVVLTNISQQRVNASLHLTDIGMTNESAYDAYEIRNGIFTYIGSESNNGLTVSMGPLEVYTLIFASPSSSRALGADSLSKVISSINSVAQSGHDVNPVMASLANATLSFYSGSYATEATLVQQIKNQLSQIQSLTTTTASTIAPTTQSTTAGGGIPEFPFQLLAVAGFTSVVVVSYLVLRRKRNP